MPPVDIDALERELAYYVSLRHRLGQEDYHLEDAVLGHRRVCLLALRDDGDPMWILRVEALDKLAERKGYVLAGEPELLAVLAEIAERDRRRRAERVAQHRGQGELVP